ncbi:hypothetical protein IFM89_001437, partial [Coptis chinensis]
MAHSLSLQRSFKSATFLLRSALLSPSSKSFSADALVPEYSRGDIGCVSGIPDEHLRRKVHNKVLENLASGKSIFCQPRTAAISAAFLESLMNIFIERWRNPLMGWTSTGDPYANVGDSALDFDSEESAKAFANNHGWDYVVRLNSNSVGNYCGIRALVAKVVGHVVLGLILAASHCRTFSLIHGYSAPLEAYMHLEHHEDVGVVWHRFPSSFFVPEYVGEVRWLDDGFRGFLPLPFNATLGGSAAAPPYFNNKNIASDEQY